MYEAIYKAKEKVCYIIPVIIANNTVLILSGLITIKHTCATTIAIDQINFISMLAWHERNWCFYEAI